MSKTLHTLAIAAALAATLGATRAAQAQTIDRVKLSDNELSCQQMYSEIKLMETVAAMPAAPAPAVAAAPAAPVAQAGNDAAAQAGAQVLTALAQGGGGRG
ncbi:MAG: hypothetical protein CFE45_17145, partial [Burkholderiales bacterium PBB5]